MRTLLQLPDEVLLNVMESFSFKDKMGTSGVCKLWHTLLNDQSLYKHWLSELHCPQGAYPLLEARCRIKDMYFRYLDYLKVLTIQENKGQNAFFEESFVRIPLIASPHFVNCWKQHPELPVTCGFCQTKQSDYYCLVRYTVICWNCFGGSNGYHPSKMCYLKTVGHSLRKHQNTLQKVSLKDEMEWYKIHQFDAKVKPWNHIVDSYMRILPLNQRARFQKECLKLASRVPYTTGKQRKTVHMNWGHRSTKNKSFCLKPVVPTEILEEDDDDKQKMVNIFDGRTRLAVGRMDLQFYKYLETPLLSQRDPSAGWKTDWYRPRLQKGLDINQEFQDLCNYLGQSYLRGLVLTQEDLEYILVEKFQLPLNVIVREFSRISKYRNNLLTKIEGKYITVQKSIKTDRNQLFGNLGHQIDKMNHDLSVNPENVELADLKTKFHSLECAVRQTMKRMSGSSKTVDFFNYHKRRFQVIENLEKEFAVRAPPKKKRRIEFPDEQRCTATTKTNNQRCNKKRKANSLVCHIHTSLIG